MTTMDFFGQQERARKATGKLVVLYALAIAAIIGCIYTTVELVLVAAGERGSPHWEILLAVAGGVLVVVFAAMGFKTMQLRGGGGKVATLLGGRRIEPDTRDPLERQLRNLVEEMAIASGVPVPEVYVLDQETGINAFAAGWSSSDAAVAVTRGCLEQLDRDELQGVIAHEFSHVFNGDMRLNIRLMGVLFGILCIATIGRIVVRAVGNSRGSSDKKGGAAAVLVVGLVVMVVGYLGVFFAHLIQAAVSRQREFLADASAVQYTRNPRGIGLALAKIGGLGAALQSPQTDSASHMLFADGMKRFLGGAMATHPPLEQRIERVLPGFLKQLRSAASMVDAAAATPLPATAAGFAGATAAAAAAVPGAAAPARRPHAVRPEQVAAAVGDPRQEHVGAARRLLESLPLDVVAASREPGRARAIVIALLLDAQPARRDAQVKALGGDAGATHDVHVMCREIAALDRTVRLPLLELSLPALRRLPSPMRQALRREARTLALADGVLSPFEFALLRTLERHLPADDQAPVRRSAGAPESLVQNAAATAVVLSVLARVGSPLDDSMAAAAFARGRAHLTPGAELALLPAERCAVAELDRAVDTLARVSPLGKRNLIAACAETVAADGRIEPDELDLLRALAELWDCPVPLLGAA